MAQYVPQPGDVVWLQFSPQAGHEQAGHRPAVVLSPMGYNAKTGLMLCCPMTNQVKGYPFEVVLAEGGVVLADQLKSVDWRARNAKPKHRISDRELSETRKKAAALLNGV
jgi:mRNA interferase MazF